MTRRSLFPFFAPAIAPKPEPRIQVALGLRDRLRRLGRYCGHRECWNEVEQNIRDGAEHITVGPCCQDTPPGVRPRVVYFRVKAEWLKAAQGVESVGRLR